MTVPRACTIVANNYLAFARVFARSFLEHHPGGEVAVLVADRPLPGDDAYADEPFQVLFAQQLGIPAFLNLALRSTVLELSTAVKPYLLAHLQRQLGWQRLCYFDPDILVLAPLDDLYQRLGESDLLLTPHITRPLADDKLPSERDILLSGVWNLGFLGLAAGAATERLLAWWQQRLLHHCRHRVEEGLFVDQRWMDFAPAFVGATGILADPGLNVAYWNLAERPVERRDGHYRAGGAPLRFFHFSGFDPDAPEALSRYQNRFTLDDLPQLAPLFTDYTRRLQAAGLAATRNLPYGYGRFADGTPVPQAARRLLAKVDAEGRRWSDPFAAPGGYFAWLGEAVDGALLPLPRLALALWDERADLRAAFPRPTGADRLAFARWLAGSGGEVAGIGEAFRRPLAAALTQLGEAPAGAPRPAAEALIERWLEPGPGRGEGEPPQPPLEAADVAWLTADAGHEPRRRPRIPRLGLAIHRRRRDLAVPFPDPLGASRHDFALWYATYGRLEHRLPAELVEPVLATLPWRRRLYAQLWWRRQQLRRRTERRPQSATAPATPATAPPPALATPAAEPPGYNVVGWSTAATGIGEACRGTLAALTTGGIDHALWPLAEPGQPPPRRAGSDPELPYAATLLHVNADMTPQVVRQLPRAALAGRRKVGYWFWELAHFPLELTNAFRHLDEVWAPSRFCLDAFAAVATVPVYPVPPCVPPPEEVTPAERGELGVPADAFCFFHTFDARSVPERKNPRALLAALEQAVAAGERPLHLLLRAHHAEAAPQLAAELEAAASRLPLTLLTGPLPRRRYLAVAAAADAYLALPRSEGLGLPLIEAMYRGQPVIAPAYGGVTDYLDDATAWVVRHRLVEIAADCGPYPAGAAWADPDPAHAAQQMVAVAAQPDEAAVRSERARRRVEALYGPAAAARRLRQQLDRIVRRSV